MKLTNLEKANRFEVIELLEKRINLTKEQISKFGEFYDRGYVYFYKKSKKVESNILWRLTILFVPLYIFIIFISLPFKMILTGRWGYGSKFYDNFHAKWWRKLGL
jgi:hypothetical protein